MRRPLAMTRLRCFPLAVLLVALAAPAQAQGLSFDPELFGGDFTGRLIQLFLLITVLSLAPGILMMATCFPFIAATNAARSATSVLPKPTSPHTRRSIGLPSARSCSTSSIARSWSSVSSHGKRSTNCSQLASSRSSTGALRSARAAAVRNSSLAIWRMRSLSRALRFCQPSPPSLSSTAASSPLP